MPKRRESIPRCPPPRPDPPTLKPVKAIRGIDAEETQIALRRIEDWLADIREQLEQKESTDKKK
jgi:hypothetical protein